MKNIWVPVSGAVAQQKKIDTIANNVANANTTGFKKDEVVFKEYLTALDKGVDDIHIPRKTWSPQDFYHTQGAQNAHVKTDGTFTQHTQGPLEPTGNPFDMAIQGEGFFEILSPQGIRYTRNGSFNISSEGLLVTKDGFPVLKAKANPEQEVRERLIQLPPNQGVNVSFQGEISADNLPIAQLSLAQFNDAHALRKEGNSFFINRDPNNLRPESTDLKVHQGYVESSNVNVVSEMSELIRAHRHFESIQKAIQAYDNITGKSVNEISKY